MVASIANLQRSALEVRKEAEALGWTEYENELEARQAGPWKNAGAELDAVARTIGPDNGAVARAIEGFRTFDAPASR